MREQSRAASLCPSDSERTPPPPFFCTPLCGRYAPVVNHLVATTTTRATALLGSFQTHLQLFCDALALGHELWDDLRLLPQVLQLLGEGGGGGNKGH